jgi:plastocyanin
VTVTVRNLAFNPASVDVPVGGTVVWAFQDGSIPHTVTADDNSFGSPPNGLTSGTFEHVFGKAGTFAYHCDVHPTMQATVHVR